MTKGLTDMGAESISLTVNGKAESLDAAMDVHAFLQKKKMNPDAVVVELNREILDKNNYENTLLAQGDSIEILQFVGGG
ncbi:MAG: sulfur carrier protein ThiS [Chitinivibrionales bacterium]